MKLMRSTYFIGSVLKAARLLSLFNEDKRKLRNIDIARLTGFNKSTVMRLLLSLEKVGFVEKDSVTGEYSIGMALFEAGSKYLDQTDLHRMAMPLISELTSRCNETAYLAVLSGHEAVLLDRVESSKAIRTTSRVGSRIPLYCTGAGKAILAFQEEREIQSILKAGKVKAFTSRTLTDKEKILKDLEEVRQLGYAIDSQEYEEEIKSIGVPIKERSGKVSASICLAGPIWLMSDEKIEKKLASEIMEAAGSISQKLGYMPDRKTYLY
jgi:IclR family KDG regulon transcriptional repressor